MPFLPTLYRRCAVMPLRGGREYAPGLPTALLGTYGTGGNGHESLL
ncbi:hypothetical protein [Spirosoma utsteinense]|uniref:Uncharacterized protein n=1 Tax=Spirosoma utsteinense TaxID=2585773 RepID=A0ABR6VZY3_9BACT|nr:hypothetical protein [Spirosoma utsteinense]MBC3789849.1 hypothetical protein [Spirosoma utsteinense]